MPRLISGTRLHCGKDMYQPGMLAAPRNHLGDHILFANMRLVDMFDRYAMRIGQFMRALADAFTPRVGKYFGVVEYLDVAGIQEAGHAACVARTGQCARDNHSVVTGEHAKQVCLITFGQGFHDQRLIERWATQILTFLAPACPA